MDDSWLDPVSFGNFPASGGAITGAGAAASVALPASKRTRKSKASVPGDVPLPDHVAPPSRRKTVYTFAQKMAAKLSGRECGACNAKDRDPDPIVPKLTRLWGGYKKTKQVSADDPLLETEGATCWYCVRVWNAMYQSRITITDLKVKLGESHVLHEEYDRFLNWLISELIKQFAGHL